jgi:CRP/FNR family transcriptional regulator, cyclic AMP receptor protein
MAQVPQEAVSNKGLRERVCAFLTDHTFFGALPQTALDSLIKRGHTRNYVKGSVIYRRGEPGDSLMVLLGGRIKIVNVTEDAREVVLNFLGVGDINGEIAALDGRKRSADVVAMEPCEVFVLYARDLLPVLFAHPAVLLDIIRMLCEKLRSASEIIEDNTLDMRGRIAKGLLRLAEKHGRRSKIGIRLELVMSQSELGGYFGLSRENVSRQLGQLREANVISMDRSQIIIIDAPGLAMIASTAM